MNAELSLFQVRIACGALAPAILALLVAIPSTMQAQGGSKRKNPTSKVYISDVAGSAQIETEDNIQDLNKRSVYNAEGVTVETKKAGAGDTKGPVFSTMVYSNGTGAFFDENTKVEIRKFVQEPFTPNRTDMDVEPSISQTRATVVHGIVGLCTSKLVAGSSMTYQTSLGSINIRGRKVVIEAKDDETKISMLEGESTVRGGDADVGGQLLKAGQQAIIRPGAPGKPSEIVVQNIPSSEYSNLDDKVAMACMAKKTVYFEVKERSVTESGAAGGANGTAPVTAFDSQPANANTNLQTTTVQEIQTVEVVPSNLPVEFTTSPARLPAATKPGG